VTAEQERELAGLMRLAQQGDQQAYAELLARLTSFAQRYVRGRAMAAAWVDDVVQETLMTVHRARHTCDTNRPFAPWFYAIVSTRFIDAVRREGRIARREQGSDELPETAGETRDRRDDIDVERIRAAVAALPARHRDVIEGLKYRDESVREVGRRLGMSESAVKVTAHRGYKLLKRWLGGAGDRAD
jgi:RNA polymerase sigma-70 factor (ECF subfamily)